MTLTIFFLLLLLPVYANKRPDYIVPEWQVGKINPFGDKGALTSALNTIPEAAARAGFILEHIRNVEEAVYATLVEERADTIFDDEKLQTCTYTENPFKNSINTYFGGRGWPNPDSGCLSEIVGTDLLNVSYTNDDIFQTLYMHGQSIHDNIEMLTNSVIDSFSRPAYSYNYKLSTSSQKCTLHRAAALRFGDTWHLQQYITSAPLHEQLPDLGRENIAEFPTVINGKYANPFEMCLLENNTDIWLNATTSLNIGRGASRPSSFGRILLEDNPAILASLDRSDLYIQQAEDALAPSNIAILVLPIFLNLVPIALLTEVSTFIMLMYTVLSDVLTVVPLAIKGFELIAIASRPHTTSVVRISSAVTLPRSEAAAAELWSAECRAFDNIRPAGIIFVTLAFVFMVFGIVSEFVAKSYVRRRREKLMQQLMDASSDTSRSSRRNSRLSASSGQPQSQRSVPSQLTQNMEQVRTALLEDDKIERGEERRRPEVVSSEENV